MERASRGLFSISTFRNGDAKPNRFASNASVIIIAKRGRRVSVAILAERNCTRVFRQSTMTTTRARLAWIDSEIELRAWVRTHRMFEAMSIEELERLVATGQWPDRAEPAPGESTLDAKERSEVRKCGKKTKDDSRAEVGKKSNFTYFTRTGRSKAVGTNAPSKEAGRG
jgi:hypothetical protein